MRIIVFINILIYAMSGCSLSDEELSKEEVVELYDEVSKTMFSEYGDDFLKNCVSFPVKTIDYLKKEIKLQNESSQEEEKIEKYKVTKTGSKDNLCFELVSEKDNTKEKAYVFVEDDKFYKAENSKTDCKEEISEDDFSLSIGLSFFLPILEIDLENSSSENSLIGTKEISNGFKQSKKETLYIVIETEEENISTKITLKKSGLFQESYNLNKFERTTKEVNDGIISICEEIIKLGY